MDFFYCKKHEMHYRIFYLHIFRASENCFENKISLKIIDMKMHILYATIRNKKSE